MRLVGIALAALVLAPACASRANGPGATTTVTTGAPIVGGSVEYYERPDASLATELCRREEACGHVGDGARYPSVAACLTDQTARVGRELDSWTCSPAASRARFEECLASIRSEICATLVDRAGRLPTCRSSVACGS